MLKPKIIVFILFAAVFVGAQAYGLPTTIDNQRIKTIFGKVDKVDTEGGVIYIKTDHGTMVFYLSAESNLYMSTHHISSIEIDRGDPVKIQYVNFSGKNTIINLVDNKQ